MQPYAVLLPKEITLLSNFIAKCVSTINVLLPKEITLLSNLCAEHGELVHGFTTKRNYTTLKLRELRA